MGRRGLASPRELRALAWAWWWRYERGVARRGQAEQRRPRLTSPEEEALYAAFERRSDAFAAGLAASNILHHRQQCAACGFPTVRSPGDYEVCCICLWEECGEGDLNRVSPPNSVSLLTARLEASAGMRVFEQQYVLSASIDDTVRGIRAFQERCALGSDAIDRADFVRNLINIVPARVR